MYCPTPVKVEQKEKQNRSDRKTDGMVIQDPQTDT